MAGPVRVREISDDEGNRLKRIVRRGSGSVVTWRRAQMVLWSAQGMSVAQIAGLAFTSKDRVRDVLHDFNADGFDSLYPRYAGGHPPVFTLAQRREIKKVAKSAPADYRLPFSRWSLAKLADFLVAGGVVEDISHEGLRALLRAASSWSSAGTCAACTRRRCGSRSSATTTPHLTTRKDKRVGQWAAASNAEIACTPTNSSWMNRLECQFTALREFTLNGTDHATHREQASMIRSYIAWRNRHTSDPRLRRIVKQANVA